jgi:ribonuclease BN (tRNA processing enzyme)
MAEIIIIGSGTGIPSLRRGSPGLVLISNKSIILIDSGPGTLWNLLKIGISYKDFDLILYTHTHPDHTADLIPILFACKYSEIPRQKDLTILGGPGFKRHFKKLKNIYGPWIDPITYQLKIIERSSRPFKYGEIKVFPKPMEHLPESIGFRIELENKKTIAISGDTDYCENIIELGKGVDLLILESSFPDEKKVRGHLTPSIACKIGSESKCKKLLLTHFYPLCDEVNILGQCREIFKGEIIIGQDFMRVEI